MISFEATGSFKGTEAWLKRLSDASVFDRLSRFGQAGVNALASATPKDTANTASQWYFEIVREKNSWSIIWGNNSINDGVPIAIILQYGHGTGTGGYVQGRDYINPALQPIFDQMSAEAWKVVTA